MKIIADLHTHNGEVCGHANSTVAGLLARAAALGHCAMALTDHGPTCDNTPYSYYTDNLLRPKEVDGVRFLAGTEADIRDYTGRFDRPQTDLLRLDWMIASFHEYACPVGTVEQHTAGYEAVLRNPAVDCLGHIGRMWHPCDYARVVWAVGEAGRTLEINNHTFEIAHGVSEACEQVIRLCKQYRVPVVVTSDAHGDGWLGRFDFSLAALKKYDFPEELVLNADRDRLFAFLARRRREKDAALSALGADPREGK